MRPLLLTSLGYLFFALSWPLAGTMAEGEAPAAGERQVVARAPPSRPPQYGVEDDGKPTAMWTADRVAWTMGGLLAAALLAMGWWRYHSTLGLNRRLNETMAAQARAEEALLKAKEAAEVADRAKSDYLARMSHELRTPLNSILGFAQLMESETFGPLGHAKYREYTGDITESGSHLLDLINDMLDISKIEAGTMELIEEDVDVSKVVAYAVRTVREQAARGKVKVSAESPEDTPGLRGDEMRLKQILLNLLSNAVKFTPPGGRVDVETHVDGGNTMVWRIADTGIGIQASDLARVLEPFQQGRGDIYQAREGAGLGLYVTDSLVKLHGGILRIESEVGKGTTVTVMFPPERTLPAT